MMAAGSNDGARGGLRRARPNIKNVASSMSPPTATPTPVIIRPIPIAVISIISTLQPVSPGAVRQVRSPVNARGLQRTILTVER